MLKYNLLISEFGIEFFFSNIRGNTNKLGNRFRKFKAVAIVISLLCEI